MSAFSSMKMPNKRNEFIIDSGASEHLTNDKDILVDYKTVINQEVTVANSCKMQIAGIESIPIIYNGQKLLVSNIYYMPDVAVNLISTSQLTRKGWKIQFDNNNCKLKYQSKNMTCNLIAKNDKTAYILQVNFDNDAIKSNITITANSAFMNVSIETLHKRFSHISEKNLQETAKHVHGLKIPKDQHLNQCEYCLMGKQHELVNYRKMTGAKKPFELVHTDIAGPFQVSGLKNERYYISFTDDFTRFVWIYSLKFKSEAFDRLVEYFNSINNQFGRTLQKIRADNAREYKSQKWLDFTISKGIKMEYTAPYTPAQNGIAERLNRTLVERAISVIKTKNIPLSLWPQIIQSIAYILNRSYRVILSKTPYEALFNQKPDISNIKVLGSTAYKLIPKNVHKKLDSHMEKGILVGFESTNYVIFIPPNRIMASRDIIINEKEKNSDTSSIQNEDDYSKLIQNDDLDDESRKQNSHQSESAGDQSESDDQAENQEENQQENQAIEPPETPIPSRPQPVVEIPRRSTRPTKGIRHNFYALAANAFLNLNSNLEFSEFKTPQSYEEPIN